MSTRRSIHVPGLSHKAPIPAGAVVGNMLFSSAINGKDTASGEYPDDVESQVRNAFARMQSLVETAGGTTADIARITVFLRDRADRKHVDEAWLALFPDPDDRPARHTVSLEREGRALVQLEIVAVIGAGGGPL